MNLIYNLNPSLLIIGAIAAAAILYRPVVGLLIMFLMIPLEIMVTFSAGFTAIKLVGIITFAAFALHVLFGKEKLEIDLRICVPLILFLFWALLTMEGNYSKLFKLAQLIAFSMMTIILCFKNERRLFLVILAFFGGCLIATFMAASGYLSEISVTDKARAAVQYENANRYAFTVGAAIIISLFLKARSKGLNRFIFLGAVIFFLYGLIISASRGAIVALCLTFLLYLAENKNRIKSLANILMILLLICTILVVGLQKGFISEFSVNRIAATKSLENTTMTSRFKVWQVGWKIVKDNFIIGVGLGNFPLAYSKYTGIYGSRVTTPGYETDPHNTYLSIFAETGCIGFALFLLFLGSLFLLVYKGKSENKVFGLCLLIFVSIVSVKGTMHFGKTYWACIILSYLISTCSPRHFCSEENPEPEGSEK